MAYNEYWETEEFEDLVTRGIIGLHETKVKKEKRLPKCIKFDEDTFKRFRNIGCYFVPHDRVVCIDEADDGKTLFTQQIDLINDELPDRAVYTTIHTDTAYLHAFYLEKIPYLPKPFANDIKGTNYRITQMGFENTYVWGCGTFVTIDTDGNLQSCYIRDCKIDPLTKRPIHFKNRPVMHKNSGSYQDFYSIWASVTIQCYQDRRYLWNVQAHDGIAKATFGVYPEQIKSLFYARGLPMTETGRKRPILHWVGAHQRRMKSGTEIDVDQYLRGIHEFEMNGTSFKITSPFKVKVI
jgi:hypothetical protein